MSELTLDEKLSAYADGELDAAQAGELETALRDDTALQRMLAQFRAMDREAAALPVPQLDGDTGAALWSLVAERTVEAPASGPESDRPFRDLSAGLPAVPEVKEARWDRAWADIRARTVDAKAASEKTTGATEMEKALPLEADFTPLNQKAVAFSEADASEGPGRTSSPFAARRGGSSIWKAAGLMAAAAALVVMANMGLVQWPGSNVGPDNPPVPVEEDEFAEALDENYMVMVKHVEGLDEPLVCFVPSE